jgi:hypothetical protein
LQSHTCLPPQSGQVSSGVVLIILTLLDLLFIYLIRDRIAFAGAMLSVVSSFLEKFNGPVYVSFFSIFFQVREWLRSMKYT